MTITPCLAIDIGTTGTKAALLNADGLTIRSAYRAYPTDQGDGRIEQNALDWWAALLEVVQELDAISAESIALTGQMQDVILLDRAGVPTYPVILYSDTRAHVEADAINADFGADQLRALTGNFQDAGSLLAKLRWLSSHSPETLTSSAYLLFGAADYVAFRLSGMPTTDSTTASTTGLFDLNTRAMLSSDQLNRLGLGHILPLLPSVHAGGAQVGTLSTELAKLLGLKSGIPIYHGPGDAGATTFGAGAGEPGQAYGYIGTSGWVAFSATTRMTNAPGVFTLAHARPDSFITIAPLLTAGGNLDWIVDVLWSGQGQYTDLIDAALDRPSPHLLYLPYLNGERSPFSDPFARGAFIGLNAAHQQADLCRAVLEGVVYAYRHALEALISEPLAALTLTGGGTRSPGWCQLFADITGLVVTITNDAANVGVRGALLAARVANGELKTYAPAGAFPSALTLRPNTAQRSHHDRQYALFKAAYLALKPIFADLNGD
jgi:xylulokinase